MVEKKHKPPSRERYEESNPNWTARLPAELKDEITTYLENTGQSRRDFMAIALKKQQADYTKAYSDGCQKGLNDGYNQGYQEGYTKGQSEGYNKGREDGFAEGKQIGIDQGTRECQIWYYCSICGSPLYIKAGSMEHRAIMDFFGYHGWAHPECANRQKYEYW